MPIPSAISGTPIMGFTSASAFKVGYTGSGSYPLSSLGWSMTDDPTFNTLSTKTAGGREVRNSLYQNPIHNFKLIFNGLNNTSPLQGNPDTDARLLYSFYLAQQGKYGEILYQTREASVVHGALALPDSNGYVEMVYSNGPFFSESVQELNNATPTIYTYNGSTYTNITSTCTFYTADSIPPYTGIVFTTTTTLTGLTLAWSGTWYYRVRFEKDNLSFEEFMYQLFKMGIGLTQVKI